MYQALYRKYRSQTFDELVGQKQVTQPLKEQVKKDEVSHAYLFSGTRGTGKTSAAKILSRAVNCLDPKEGNPCNQCEHCKGILDEKIMDVVEMDAASNNGVDDIRELKERVVYPPSTCKYKVYIIDEVHMLSKGAFNALLKILEEPPSHLIFILATTEPERLPQTILSRCQRFNFKRISMDEIIKNMEMILEKENKSVDHRGLVTIAGHAGGAMRDALSLLDQCLGIGDHVSYEDAVDALGMTNEDFLKDMVKKLLKREPTSLLESLDELYLLGKDMLRLTEDLIGILRNILILKETTGGKELILEEDLSSYDELISFADFSFVMTCIEELGESLVRGKYSMNPRQVLEMTLLKLTSPSTQTLEERLLQIEKVLEGKTPLLETAPIPKEKVPEKTSFKWEGNTEIIEKKKDKGEKLPKGEEKREVETLDSLEEQPKNGIIKENSSSIDLVQVKEDWQEILKEIKNRSQITVYGLLQDGKPTEVLNNQVVIGYDPKFQFHVDALSNERNHKFLEALFSDYYQTPMSVKLETIKDNQDRKRAIDEVKDLFGNENIEFV
ncbi:MAG: DNA polymerase III subunit gamma/tau [Tissierellia bacterium]|nr:DNA polymerase III subunit gamma/tau [Tissierellia bacterium]